MTRVPHAGLAMPPEAALAMQAAAFEEARRFTLAATFTNTLMVSETAKGMTLAEVVDMSVNLADLLIWRLAKPTTPAS